MFFLFFPIIFYLLLLQQNLVSNCIFNWHIHMKKQFTLI